MDRHIDPKKLTHYMTVYEKHLTQCRKDMPYNYLWPESELSAVLGRIEQAILRGSISIDSAAFKRTHKELGIKHTYTAMWKFLNEEKICSMTITALPVKNCALCR